jgi:hypothetical protein
MYELQHEKSMETTSAPFLDTNEADFVQRPELAQSHSLKKASTMNIEAVREVL